MGRRPTPHSTNETTDPSKVPLPKTPTKTAEDSRGHKGYEQELGTKFPTTFQLSNNSSDDDDDSNEFAGDGGAQMNKYLRQIQEVTDTEMQNVTPRIEVATHRPLGQIKAFPGLRSKSENSMQWLRAFVYEMKGTRASPDEWCMLFELRLRDGALHYRRDRRDRDYDRRRDDSRNVPRVTLAEASVTDIFAELQERDVRSSRGERPRNAQRNIPNRGSEADSDELSDDSRQLSDTRSDGYSSDGSGRPPTETGLVPVGLPQLAEPAVEVECIYAFVGKCEWPEEDGNGIMKTTELLQERSGNFGGGGMKKYSDEGSSGDDTDNWVASAVEITPRRHFAKEVRLLPNERMGWWSAQKFDRRVRMRTLVNGAFNGSRTRILLDTGANVSVISERFAKILRFRDIPNHGRCMEVQGITKRKTATSRRASVKITLGWERVDVFDVWIMDHNAGVDVVLGTDFMIPGGVRLDLFNATAKLPDEVMVPLIKTQNMIDETGGTATDDSRRLDSPHRDVCADDYSVLQAETSPRTSHEPHRQTYWKVRILNTVKLDEAEGRQHSGRDRSGCWKPLEGKNEDSKVID
ncbi:unnamed protein product [Phytophthora lilii]|uniref:Unnamed protein product n=1 Tax=Phytophthora lilii TaxID=2077276 RepID=A0A9W6XDC5_9STRA|nr:unnamed protein product [Phytophthora lilii]